MPQNTPLGRVESLFPYVEKEWWRDAFNEEYLRTDGDCVEDPLITEAECVEILRIPDVASIFDKSSMLGSETETETENAARVLDLCCGQGRHSINLAKKYPAVEFHGLDQSKYLIELAVNRAKEAGTGNIVFSIGEARQIPGSDNSFDLVILMGNSFGTYSDDEDNKRLLEEVSRVLKPVGVLLIDLVSAEYTKSNFSPGGWEWIDGGVVGASNTSKTNRSQLEGRNLIACREREMSSDGKWMASREMIIDLQGGVWDDLFYKVRLYELDEMKSVLEQCGLSVPLQEPKKLSAPTNTQNGDAGMMASRHLVVSHKARKSTGGAEETGNGFYAHPNLVVTTDPVKGRQVRSVGDIEAGTLLISDQPWALVPDVTPGSGDLLTCSRLECSKRIVYGGESVTCPNNCISDVVWCNDECRRLGKAHHEFECSWLKEIANTIRAQEGEYDFHMLWIIVRILAHRQMEMQIGTFENPKSAVGEEGIASFEYSWNEINSKIISNQSKIPADKLQRWGKLVRNYISTSSSLPQSLTPEELVTLICKEEMNTFGLYPKATGLYPLNKPHETRGRCYGLAFYTRATLMNHSCLPNSTHKPDGRGRMVVHAIRAISAGEECVIAYFDLAEHEDVKKRRKSLEELFTFVCMCERCISEAKTYNVSGMEAQIVYEEG